MNEIKKIKLSHLDASSLAYAAWKKGDDIAQAFFMKIMIDNFPEDQKDKIQYDNLIYNYNTILTRIEQDSEMEATRMRRIYGEPRKNIL